MNLTHSPYQTTEKSGQTGSIMCVHVIMVLLYDVDSRSIDVPISTSTRTVNRSSGGVLNDCFNWQSLLLLNSTNTRKQAVCESTVDWMKISMKTNLCSSENFTV